MAATSAVPAQRGQIHRHHPKAAAISRWRPILTGTTRAWHRSQVPGLSRDSAGAATSVPTATQRGQGSGPRPASGKSNLVFPMEIKPRAAGRELGLARAPLLQAGDCGCSCRCWLSLPSFAPGSTVLDGNLPPGPGKC